MQFVRFVVGIVLVLCFSSQGKAQDFNKDISLIIAKMDTVKKMSIKANVVVYAKKGGSKIYSALTSVDYSYGRTITTLGEMEMYKSNTYEVQVDHEDKSMMIHKVKESKMDLSGIDLKELKKLIGSENDKVAAPVYQLISNQNGVKTYTLKDYQTLKECTIVLNMQTLAIDKIIYEYTPESESKGQYCIIDYTVFDYTPNFEKGKFEANHFFIIKEGSYQPVSRLKNYRVIVE